MVNAGCSHTCINTKGSFVCTYVGYIDPFVFFVLQNLNFSSTVVQYFFALLLCRLILFLFSMYVVGVV